MKTRALDLAAGFLGGALVMGVLGVVYERRHERASAQCRDEVANVDGAHGLVACSREDQSMELKDGYLVCRCGKKK